MNEATALYLYALTSAPATPEAPPPGIEGEEAPRPYPCAGLVAWIGEVDRSAFEGERGEANLKDLSWLGPRALRHEAIVEWAMQRHGSVYPLPFGTLFSSLEALEDALRQRREAVLAALARVRGCHEWGVVASIEREAALDALLAQRVATGEVLLPEAPGRRHLELRRQRQRLAPELPRWLQQQRERLEQALQPHVRARVVRPARGEGFNLAFLVADEVREAFTAAVQTEGARLESEGLQLRCSGPWPPYSFCAEG